MFVDWIEIVRVGGEYRKEGGYMRKDEKEYLALRAARNIYSSLP